MDFIKRKQEIISAYYFTGRLKLKVDAICFKWYVTRNSKIAEDIESEVFYALSNYNPEKLCAVYDKQGTIEGLAVQIAKYQFRLRKENPENPNNSFGTKLLWGSTFHTIKNISVTDTFNDSGDSTSVTLYDGDIYDEMNYTPDIWRAIKERLTASENQFIEDYLAGVKFYKRKPTNKFKEYKQYVFTKIKNMDLSKPLTQLEIIRTKLDMPDLQKFDVMFDDNLSYKEKLKKLKYSESKYLSQRRILLKKIKALTTNDR